MGALEMPGAAATHAKPHDDPPACPVCGSTGHEIYLRGSGGRPSSAAIGSSRDRVHVGEILRCVDCGSGYTRWRPTDAELASLYAGMGTGVYESELAARRRTAARHADIVSRHLDRGRLLDVGCASGAFLEAAADRGWDVVGVEPSPSLADAALERIGERGSVVNGALQEAGLDEASFDAVTLWDVLEHVSDPAGFLSLCRDLVRPGGVVAVNVPDLESPPARLMGRRWPLLLPEHLQYFTRAGLEACGRRAGLELREVGRRRAAFSLGYVFQRLSQHELPGVRLAAGLARKLRLEDRVVSLPLGERFAVWRRP